MIMLMVGDDDDDSDDDNIARDLNMTASDF